ncbi:MAG TPA: GNAT family N-acetyltransferase [Novosphingobium sp.]|nr:GNAT family N-acetyltransferase [Novosphingobium sp.]
MQPTAAERPAVPAACAAADWADRQDPDVQRAWDDLALRASEPSPFQERWYLQPALEQLDPQGTVRLVRVDSGGTLIGLIPVRAEPRYYRRPIPHLASWVHGNCFLGLPLVAAGQEQPFWRAFLHWADRNAGRALFLHLSTLPLEGPLWQALQAVTAEQGRLAGLVYREERALLASELSPADYFEASLSGKKRKELRRQMNRLAELGELHFERQRNAEGLEQWNEEFLALEHSGWKGTAGSALASHHTSADMFRAAMQGAAVLGKLERLTLRLDGAPIAMLINFLTPPGSFSFKTAFDERYSRFSPGVLIQRENLDLLADPAVEWCDSCASADHPMIDHIWRERRAIGHVSIAIGGRLRRAAFGALLRRELGGSPTGL